ncbi:MAG: aspartate 1-decarboxylase [Bdellovibrionales bacterium]|nr:aspartate 1-decarboxylase [Bdellovibrionales bacterium]
MQRTMMKSKLHRATVTEANLEYEGSITIDKDLLKTADIWPHERVEVYNITNGNRFATYAIEGPSGSGVICINGAAAHLARPGDKVIICSYVTLEEREIQNYEPRVVLLGEGNREKRKS